MALQTSGAISLNNINVELGRSGTSNIGLNQAESGTYAPLHPLSSIKPNGSTPNSMSEWRGYDHTVHPQATLVDPTNGATGIAKSGYTFRCTIVTSANRYNFQFGSSGLSSIYNSYVRTTNTPNSFNLTGNFTYYWRARGGYFDGTNFFWGPFSTIRYFTTGP